MADRAMTEIEAKEAALSLMIRGEIAGMAADGELRLHLAPLILEILEECGIKPIGRPLGGRH